MYVSESPLVFILHFFCKNTFGVSGAGILLFNSGQCELVKETQKAMMPRNGLASFSVHLLSEWALDSVCSLSETGVTVIEFLCEITSSVKELQCFDTVGWEAGRTSGL